MGEVNNLTKIVQEIVEDYSTPVLKGVSFAVSDAARQTYTVLTVPDQSRKFHSGIAVLAHIVDDLVIIDEDTTDRPLYKALMEAGIPREKIILAYAGEDVPTQA